MSRQVLIMFISLALCSCVEVILLDDIVDAGQISNEAERSPYSSFDETDRQGSDMSAMSSRDFGPTTPLPIDMAPLPADMEPLPADMEPLTADMEPLPADMGPLPADMMIEQEECNHIDDDQDGEVDEGLLNDCGQCPDEVSDELCDGIDNDCNQQIDEGDICPCPTLTVGNSLYLFCGDRSSWGDAQMSCTQYDFELASIQDNGENAALFSEMQRQGFSDTWIGLTDQAQEGTFVWSDGSQMTYTQWGSGEPNNGGGSENCGIILMENRQSNWDDRPCSHDYSFICERALP